jgi:hypothetical protein
MGGTNAQTTISDSSQTSTMTLTVPATGTGSWWYVFNLDGATGGITVKNQVQNCSPGPYAAPSGALEKT